MYLNTTLMSDETLQDKCSEIKTGISAVTSQNPKVSVYFCAFNEQNYLLPTLSAYARMQTSVPIEIVGVANACTDRTKEILEQCGIRTLYEPRKGTSFARQTGLENLRGHIAIEGSADTLVPPEWVNRHYEAYSDSEVVQAYGPIAYHDAHLSFLMLRTSFRAIRLVGNQLNLLPEVIGGPNRSYKTDVARSVGGFVSGINLGEDVLISRKIAEMGKTIKLRGKSVEVLTDGRRYRTTQQILGLLRKRLLHMWAYNRELSGPNSFVDIRE
ncbi:MAG: hypothetical protein HHAS10_10300 [Candidatus Altimarinota bacterium]